MRPSRRATAVRQPPWDPTEGPYVDYPPVTWGDFEGRGMAIPMAGSRPPLRPGERAPHFSLALVSEVGTVSLRDYLGRAPVLLVLLRYIW